MTRRSDRSIRAIRVLSSVAMVAISALIVPIDTAHAGAVVSRPAIDHSTHGDGSAHAGAHASSGGRLGVVTEARGGFTRNGRPPRPTAARAEASVTESFSVDGGTYRVVLTYADISTERREVGPDVLATLRRRSRVDFVSMSGGGDSGLRQVQSLPRSGDVTTVLMFDVAPGTRGRLVVEAELYARSAADRRHDHAVAEAVVEDVQISVTRVS